MKAPRFLKEYVNWRNKADKQCELMLPEIRKERWEKRDRVLLLVERDYITVNEAMKLIQEG